MAVPTGFCLIIVRREGQCYYLLLKVWLFGAMLGIKLSGTYQAGSYRYKISLLFTLLNV